MGGLSNGVYVWRLEQVNTSITLYCDNTSLITIDEDKTHFHHDNVEPDRLDKLAKYFIYFNVLERYNISFNSFVDLVDSGEWENIVRSRRLLDVYSL